MGRWNHGLKVNCAKDTASALPPPRMEKAWGFSPEAIPSRKKIDFQTSSDLSILGAASSSSNRLALPRDY
jgi:hypothetical protein